MVLREGARARRPRPGHHLPGRHPAVDLRRPARQHHDITAARELVLPGLRPWLKTFPCLADSGYEGAGAGVLIPVKKPRKGDLDTDTKCRNILLRGLRYQGERGFALLKERWRALQHITVSPTQIGDIAKAALVLTQIEHKKIS